MLPRSFKMKLEFYENLTHKKSRDNVEAIGAGDTIKKHSCALLKLPNYQN